MQRSTISILAAAALLVGSLVASFSYQWVTANSQGPITYSVREAGLPLQFLLFEVSSPVGPSSYVKVDLLLMLADFIIWACLVYGALYFLSVPKGPKQVPPS